ncbi:hypothetical protein ABT075_13850 [Streptomyces sp. NPDC002677]|uniref:WXG100-like domain-containing protein n=1 Tax=Streptomyces sp. NPDC002677 TaxID=3154774 RepID=UPI00331AF034
MSLKIPPELDWVAKIAVGQDFPKGDEDRLHALGDAVDAAAQHLAQLVGVVDPATAGVLAAVGGQLHDEYQQYTRQMATVLPNVASSAQGLGELARETAVQMEYAKYSLLLQIIWLAYALAELFAWGLPEAAAAIVKGVQAICRQILLAALRNAAIGTAFMVGSDAAVQVVQFLKGDRTHWDLRSTLQAAEGGAIGGAFAGVFSEVGQLVAPKFAASLAGQLTVGAATGVATTLTTDAINGSGGNGLAAGLAAVSGAVGGLYGGRKGDATGAPKLPDHFDLPDLSGTGDLAAPGEFGDGAGDGFGVPTPEQATDGAWLRGQWETAEPVAASGSTGDTPGTDTADTVGPARVVTETPDGAEAFAVGTTAGAGVPVSAGTSASSRGAVAERVVAEVREPFDTRFTTWARGLPDTGVREHLLTEPGAAVRVHRAAWQAFTSDVRTAPEGAPLTVREGSTGHALTHTGTAFGLGDPAVVHGLLDRAAAADMRQVAAVRAFDGAVPTAGHGAGADGVLSPAGRESLRQEWSAQTRADHDSVFGRLSVDDRTAPTSADTLSTSGDTTGDTAGMVARTATEAGTAGAGPASTVEHPSVGERTAPTSADAVRPAADTVSTSSGATGDTAGVVARAATGTGTAGAGPGSAVEHPTAGPHSTVGGPERATAVPDRGVDEARPATAGTEAGASGALGTGSHTASTPNPDAGSGPVASEHRPEAVWQERIATRVAELPARVDDQLGREQAARAAVAAVQNPTGGSWHQILPTLGSHFTDTFRLREHPLEIGPVKEAAAAVSLTGAQRHAERPDALTPSTPAGEANPRGTDLREAQYHVARAAARDAAVGDAVAEARTVTRETSGLPADLAQRHIDAHRTRVADLFDTVVPGRSPVTDTAVSRTATSPEPGRAALTAGTSPGAGALDGATASWHTRRADLTARLQADLRTAHSSRDETTATTPPPDPGGTPPVPGRPITDAAGPASRQPGAVSGELPGFTTRLTPQDHDRPTAHVTADGTPPMPAGDPARSVARDAQWRGFLQRRDRALNTRLDLEAGFERVSGDLPGEVGRAVERFSAEDLFAGRYLEGGHPETSGTARTVVEESYRKQMHDAYLLLATEADGGVVSEARWQAAHHVLREQLPVHVERIATRQRAMDLFAREFDGALENFRRHDVFGGRNLPEGGEDVAGRLHRHPVALADRLRHPEPDDVPATLADVRQRAMLGHVRAVDAVFAERIRHGITETVRTALGRSASGEERTGPQTGGESAVARGRAADPFAEDGVRELRADLDRRLRELSDQERSVGHALQVMDRELAAPEEDLRGEHAPQEARDWARRSFQSDLRSAFARLHAGADGQAGERAAAWEAHVEQATTKEALAARVAYAEYRHHRMAEAERAFEQADTHFRRTHTLIPLSESQRERVHEEWTKVAEQAVEDHWFGHLAHPDFRSPAPGEAARTPNPRPFTDALPRLRATLPDRFTHEADLEHVLSDAGRDFHALVGHPDSRFSHRHTVRDTTVDTLGKDFREKTVTAYDEAWSPVAHDITAWLAHEARHENLFAETLTAHAAAPLAPREPDAPPARAPRPADPAQGPETPADTRADHRTDDSATTAADQVQKRLPEPTRSVDSPVRDEQRHSTPDRTPAPAAGEQLQQQSVAERPERPEPADAPPVQAPPALRSEVRPGEPFHSGPRFDARRVEGRDGTELTELTVKVAFAETTADTAAAGVLERTRTGVSRLFHGPGLYSHRGRLRITVQQVRPDQSPHLTVGLTGHDDRATDRRTDRVTDLSTWPRNAEPEHYARLIGLHTGLLNPFTSEPADASSPSGPPVVPVPWQTFERQSLAPVTDHPFLIRHTVTGEAGPAVQVHLTVETPDLAHQPPSARDSLHADVRASVTDRLGPLLTAFANGRATDVFVHFVGPGRGALIKLAGDPATGGRHLQAPVEELTSRLAAALDRIGGDDGSDTLSAAAGDDGTLLEEDTTGETGTLVGTDPHAEDKGLERPFAEAPKSAADITAWLRGVTDTDREATALFDPAGVSADKSLAKMSSEPPQVRRREMTDEEFERFFGSRRTSPVAVPGGAPGIRFWKRKKSSAAGAENNIGQAFAAAPGPSRIPYGGAPGWNSSGQASAAVPPVPVQAAPVYVPPAVEGYAGALGFEAELHDYLVSIPPGDSEGNYPVAVDSPNLMITFDAANGVVLEVVSKPARVLDGGSPDGRADRRQVMEEFADVMRRLGQARPNQPLGSIFPERAGYRVDPLAAEFPVRRRSGGGGAERLFLHYTVGVPIGGLAEFIRHASSHARQDSFVNRAARQHATDALEFGRQGAERFRQWRAAPQFAHYGQGDDVREIEGFLALTYTQVAAVAQYALTRQSLLKNFSIVSSRESLAGMRAELSELARGFLQADAGYLRQSFLAAFSNHAPVASSFEGGHVLDRPLPLRWARDTERVHARIGDYLDNALLANPARPLRQRDVMGIRSDFTELDHNRHGGTPLIQPSVARLELRSHGARDATTADLTANVDDLARTSLRLYNDARGRRGLPPVGRPVAVSPAYGAQTGVMRQSAVPGPPSRSTRLRGPYGGVLGAGQPAHSAAVGDRPVAGHTSTAGPSRVGLDGPRQGVPSTPRASQEAHLTEVVSDGVRTGADDLTAYLTPASGILQQHAPFPPVIGNLPGEKAARAEHRAAAKRVAEALRDGGPEAAERVARGIAEQRKAADPGEKTPQRVTGEVPADDGARAGLFAGSPASRGNDERRSGPSTPYGSAGRRSATRGGAPGPVAGPSQSHGGAAAVYQSAEELTADLQRALIPATVPQFLPPGPLGPDLFGLRRAPGVPAVLRNQAGVPYDYSGLSVDAKVEFLRRVDMAAQSSNQVMDPRGWQVPQRRFSHSRALFTTQWHSGAARRRVDPLPFTTLEMPRLVHAIWLGGPLNTADAPQFWERFGNDARRFGNEATFVLWTDVPRAEVGAALAGHRGPAGTRAAKVHDLVQWAGRAGIRLLNVDEVFNENRPMRLNDAFRTELAKQTGPGWAAASDLLRVAVVKEFGGLYSDGDHVIDSLADLHDIGQGNRHDTYAVYSEFVPQTQNYDIANGVLLAPAGHPVLTMLEDTHLRNYEKTQRQLYQPFSNAIQAGRVDMSTHRYSVMFRTGPNTFTDLFVDLGYVNTVRVPSVQHITMSFEGSWRAAVPPVSVAENWSKDRTRALAKSLVHTAVRGLSNRDGDLHLTQLDKAIRKSGHPDRDLLWRSVFQFLQSRNDLASRVRTVTPTSWDDGTGRWEQVELPRDVAATIQYAQAPPDVWLAEYSYRARLWQPGLAGGAPVTGRGPDFAQDPASAGPSPRAQKARQEEPAHQDPPAEAGSETLDALAEADTSPDLAERFDALVEALVRERGSAIREAVPANRHDRRDARVLIGNDIETVLARQRRALRLLTAAEEREPGEARHRELLDRLNALHTAFETSVRAPAATSSHEDPAGAETTDSDATEQTVRPPWYTAHGMLGVHTLRDAGGWSHDEANGHAREIAARLADRELARAVEPHIAELLTAKGPAKWHSLLAGGRMVPLDGRVVWLRPVLHNFRATQAPAAADAVRDYEVRYAATSVQNSETRATTRAADTLLFAALNLKTAVASAFVGTPVITGQAERITNTKVKQDVVSGRKVFVADVNAFDADLRVEIFTDGQRSDPEHPYSVPRAMTVEFPDAYSQPDEPVVAPGGEPVAAEAPASTSGPQAAHSPRPRLAGEVVNALDTAPVVVALQHALRAEGLNPRITAEVVREATKLLNESTLLDRSRWSFTSGDPSNPVVRGLNLPGLPGFDGHFRLRTDIVGLQLVGFAPSRTRQDLGVGLARLDGHGGKSAITYSVLANVSGLNVPTLSERVRAFAPLGGLGLGTGRKWSHTLTSQPLSHAILNTDTMQARYRARVRVNVEWTSRSHPRLGTVDALTDADISVPWRDGAGAREFEEHVLGGVHSPAVRDAGPVVERGPVAAQPHVRALLREAGIAPRRTEVRPARLDTPVEEQVRRARALPAAEPPALARRHGIGYAVAAALPGAALVEEHFRSAVRDLAGRDRGVSWALVDRQLSSYFGQPALEGELHNLLAGVAHTIHVGDHRLRLSVRAHLLDHRGTVSYPMTVNNRAALGETLTARVDTTRTVSGGLGAAVRFKVSSAARLQLGGLRFRLRADLGRAEGFTDVAKSYRRMENVNDVDEHRYDVVYELSLVPENRPREAARWWIDEPGLLAQIVVPQEHAPREHPAPEELLGAGNVSFSRSWPGEPARGRPGEREARFDFGRGSGGLYPAFPHSPSLEALAADLFSRVHGLPRSRPGREPLLPEALSAATRPGDLAAYFGQLVEASGRVVRLPDVNGWHSTMKLRLRGYRPRRAPQAAGTGPTEIEQYAQAVARRSERRNLGVSLTFQAGLGPQLRFGSDLGNDAELADTHGEEHLDAHRPGGRIIASAHAEIGWQPYNRARERDNGAIEVTRATYADSVAFRADAAYEVTLTRWKPGRDPQSVTRYLRVTDGMELLAPARRVEDILPEEAPAPAPEPTPAPHPPAAETAFAETGRTGEITRDYLGGRLLPAASHPELLDADSVLPYLVERLADRGVLRAGAADKGTPLWRSLQAAFRSESLTTQWAALTDGGVRRWFPVHAAESSTLSGFAGTSHYLWVNVEVTDMAAAHAHRHRDGVRLTLRGESVTDETNVRGRGTSHGLGVEAEARGGERVPENDQQVHGALGVTAGLVGRDIRTVTAVRKDVDIYRADTRDSSEEFTHRLGFRVRMGVTTQLPEVLGSVGRTLVGAAALIARPFGTRHLVENAWYRHQPWSWQHSSDGTPLGGEVRLLVPSHLTVALDGPPAGSPLARVPVGTPRWSGPDGTTARPGPEPRRVADLLAELHPWDVPAARAVREWAKVAGTPSRKRPDLEAAGTRDVPAVGLLTRHGLRYHQETARSALRARISRLLAHDYQVDVAGRTVTVGFELTSAQRLHPDNQDVPFKARRYQPGGKSEDVGAEQDAGRYAGLIPEGGGSGGGAIALMGREILEAGRERGNGIDGGAAETVEHNRAGTRPYAYYRFGVDVVLRGAGGRELRVHVPDGLTGMLPVTDGRLAAALVAELGHLFAGPAPVPGSREEFDREAASAQTFLGKQRADVTRYWEARATVLMTEEHAPPPVRHAEMTEGDAARLAVHENIRSVIARQLYRDRDAADPEDTARRLSREAGDLLGTRRTNSAQALEPPTLDPDRLLLDATNAELRRLKWPGGATDLDTVLKYRDTYTSAQLLYQPPRHVGERIARTIANRGESVELPAGSPASRRNDEGGSQRRSGPSTPYGASGQRSAARGGTPGPVAGPSRRDGGAAGYRNAGELVADLQQAAAPLPVGPFQQHGALGPDLFDLRQVPAVPPVLRNPHGVPYDYSRLSADEKVEFLRRADMLAQTPGRHMDPLGWGVGQGQFSYSRRLAGREWHFGPSSGRLELLASDRLEMPRLVHAIWLGGPLNQADAPQFWERFYGGARRFGNEATFVLWTDVPRAEIRDALAGVGQGAPAGTRAGRVRDLVRWAADSGIRLVNVDEVFNANRPMRLNDGYRTELAKKTGPGWAAASDLLRVAVVKEFGGLYNDGDQVIDSLADLRGIGQENRRETYAIYAEHNPQSGQVSIANGVVLAPAGHPVLTMIEDMYERHYTLTQGQLYQPYLPAINARQIDMNLHRHSVMFRTGPSSFSGLFADLGYSRTLPPSVAHITVHSENTWRTAAPPGGIAEQWSRNRTLDLAKNLAHSAVRGLYNRNGDLHVTALNEALQKSSHPDKDLVWRGVFQFLGSREDLRAQVRMVTLDSWEGGNRGWVSVQLPRDVRDMVQFTPGTQPFEWLSEYSRWATLLRAPAQPRTQQWQGMAGGAPVTARAGDFERDPASAGPSSRPQETRQNEAEPHQPPAEPAEDTLGVPTEGDAAPDLVKRFDALAEALVKDRGRAVGDATAAYHQDGGAARILIGNDIETVLARQRRALRLFTAAEERAPGQDRHRELLDRLRAVHAALEAASRTPADPGGRDTSSSAGSRPDHAVSGRTADRAVRAEQPASTAAHPHPVSEWNGRPANSTGTPRPLGSPDTEPRSLDSHDTEHTSAHIDGVAAREAEVPPLFRHLVHDRLRNLRWDTELPDDTLVGAVRGALGEDWRHRPDHEVGDEVARRIAAVLAPVAQPHGGMPDRTVLLGHVQRIAGDRGPEITEERLRAALAVLPPADWTLREDALAERLAAGVLGGWRVP